MVGVKYDETKPRWTLVPWSSMKEIVQVLEFGAQKYAPDNWMKIEDAKNRYANALFRHLVAWVSGEKKDPETGLNHLAHAGCCVLFLLWFDKAPEMPKETPTIKARMEKVFK